MGGFDHGARSRFNAWFFTVLDGYINHVSREHKRAAFSGIDGGTVLEIGAGVGANLRYLPPGTRLVALEPNLRMLATLERRSRAAGVEVEIRSGAAERIPLPDGSVDEVICSLVLCTVEDPQRVLTEVRRVLRPGGRFRFVEHVGSPPWRPRRLVQRLLRRPWAWVFEGCQLTRATAAHVEAAGFSHVQLTHRRLRQSLFYPVNTAISGVATT